MISDLFLKKRLKKYFEYESPGEILNQPAGEKGERESINLFVVMLNLFQHLNP